MMIRYRSRFSQEKDTRVAARCRPTDESKETKTMRWETPRAIDFRFGMEITMYIANR